MDPKGLIRRKAKQPVNTKYMGTYNECNFLRLKITLDGLKCRKNQSINKKRQGDQLSRKKKDVFLFDI